MNGDANRVNGSSSRVRLAALIVMMAGLASQSLVFSLPAPLLPALAHGFGAQGHTIAQLLFALASLGLMLTSIASGAIVRAVGVRAMLIAGAALYAVAGSLPALTANAAVLLGSRLVLGGACGLMTTGCALLLAYHYAGPARGRMLGYQTGIASFAAFVVVLLAGASVGPLGWQPAFLLYGLTAVPILLLAIFGVARVPLPPRGGAGIGAAFARTWPICLAGGALLMVPMVVGSNGPFLLVAIGVTKPLIQSAIISGLTVASAISGALFGRCQALMGVSRTFATGLLLGGLGMACMGWGETGAVVATGYALVGVSMGLFLPHLWNTATTLVAEAQRGEAVGLLNTSLFFGGFLYPFLFAPLQRGFGMQGAFLTIGALLVAAAVYVLLARRSRLAGSTAGEPA